MGILDSIFNPQRARRLRELPKSGYCQMCGKSHVPRTVGKKELSFYCSTACRREYDRVSLLASMGGFVLDMSGRLDTERLHRESEKAAQTLRTCWNCGSKAPFDARSCPSCRSPEYCEIYTAKFDAPTDSTPRTEPKTTCRACGAEILATTAQATGGYCRRPSCIETRRRDAATGERE